MEQKQFLDFENFIKKYYPNYIVDNCNLEVIKKLSLWSSRSEKFEDSKCGLYLDKGILIMGTVGTGKTDLFNILSIYLDRYLKSRYAFSYGVVWKFTSDFSKDGYDSFDGQERNNRYYDELCLTDSRTKFPNKEQAMHFGSKILIGEELIMLRYNSFKKQGWQTHFSTNATPAELFEIYGERAYSRLTEMCNFLSLTGDDRRNIGIPNIYNNVNNPIPPKPLGLEGSFVDDSKASMEQQYKDFLENKSPSIPRALTYTILGSFKVQVATEDELRFFMESIEAGFNPNLIKCRKFPSREYSNEKAKYIWEQARATAVRQFFQKMKDNGCQSIFGEREVDVDKMIEKENQ